MTKYGFKQRGKKTTKGEKKKKKEKI